jgi:putative membrane protein
MILGLRETRGHTRSHVTQLLRFVVGGFCMGSADLVPGVSGGTIALVIGVYERLVGSIREGSSALGAILSGRFDRSVRHLKSVEWRLLLSLLVGIAVAVLTLARVIEHQLEVNATAMAGGFFGLVIGSVVIAWRLLKMPALNHYLIAVVVGIGVFGLLGLGEDVVVDNPSFLTYFGAGALAICAMILPGISGSLILLLVGMYQAILGAVNDRDLVAVGVFAVGAVVGLALFSQILHWALARHHDVVLAGLVGLMAGSLRILWPWPNGVDSSALGAPGSDLLLVVGAGLIGLVLVFGVARLAAPTGNVSVRQPIR